MTVKQNQWTPEFIETLELIAYSNSVVEIIPFSTITMGEKQLILNTSHPNLEQLRAYLL